jgi:hypothetical protein
MAGAVGMTDAKTRVAIWIRASDPSQHAENQLPDLQAWATRRGWEVVKVYEVRESAWRGRHQKALSDLVDRQAWEEVERREEEAAEAVRELIRRELLANNGGNAGLSDMP